MATTRENRVRERLAAWLRDHVGDRGIYRTKAEYTRTAVSRARAWLVGQGMALDAAGRPVLSGCEGVSGKEWELVQAVAQLFDWS